MKSPRSKLALVATAALAALVAVWPAARSTAQSTPPTPAVWNFDEYIATSPMPLTSHAAPANGARTTDLGVHAHSRDVAYWQALEPMPAIHHGPECQSPTSGTPPTHPSSSPMKYEEAVFICSANPHVMTAIDSGPGYGLIYLTPAAMLDFGSGPQTVSFDITTWWSASRDWWDVWLTPYDDNLVAPLEHWLPDLSGEPERSVHVRLSGKGSMNAERTKPDGSGGIIVEPLPASWWNEYPSVITPSKSVRSKFRITISQTHLKVDLLNTATGTPLMTWVDADFPTPLDWSQGVVQFGHHSYNPSKDCNVANIPAPDGTCGPNTWHWDNLALSNAVPFTMIGANERFQVAATPGEAMTFTLPRPSPENAHLRVSAAGAGYQYSVDNGASWVPMTVQAAKKDGQGGMQTFWTPFPAGATSVKLRATQRGWWSYEAVNNVEVWSQQQPQSPPTPVVLPPTPTVMPTEVPTSTPVNTPTALPTSTPVPPTATPAPGATPDPNVCTVTVSRAGTPVAAWECD